VLVYAADERDLAAVVGEELRTRELTVAVAESCTGGLCGKRLTDVPGSSAYVQAGFITYSNDAKRALLGVRGETLDGHGAVSGECAQEMAAGARVRGDADIGIAITGIAGPGGGTDEKPVGTTWITVDAGAVVHTRRFIFIGDRGDIRERAAQAALDMLRRVLLGEHD
jgi:PncC family amidohydrolase